MKSGITTTLKLGEKMASLEYIILYFLTFIVFVKFYKTMN